MPPDASSPSERSSGALPSAAVSSPVLDDAPVAPAGALPAVDVAVLGAYLARPDTQTHLRNVVAGALGPKATRSLVDDLSNEAQTNALGADTLAGSVETMPAWVDGIARKTVAAWFAARKEEREALAELALPGGPADLYVPSDADAKGFLVSKWLREQVKGNASERELVDMLAYAAKSKKTYDAIAAERNTTPAAIYNRIYRLKEKYEPLWREHKRNRNGMIVLLVVLAAVIAVLVWLAMRPRLEAKPTDDLPVLRPVPTASATEEPFNNAAPTDSSTAAPVEPPFLPKDRPLDPGNAPPNPGSAAAKPKR